MKLIRGNPKPGFAMVEALVGMVILAISFIAFHNLFFDTGFKYIRRARDYAIAVNICERCLNSAKAKIFSLPKAMVPTELPPGETDLTPLIKNGDTFQQSLQCAEDIQEYEVKQTVVHYGARLFKISVEMKWSMNPQAPKTMRVCLSTYVTNPEYYQ